jgi:lipoate-protein ligase A
MRIINDFYSTDPYFNLAAEEYFLTQSQEHICRFWQNEHTVVIGKHQVMPAEVNTQVAQERKIQIARRISGGGTVYHDLGNLNFTFIANNVNGENLIDFKQFTQPIIDALKVLGLDVQHSGRNDLLLKGLKISGNAEHLSQKLKRTMHHGTLLYNSNLDNLGAILKTPIDQFIGKFVQSKRSKVTNLSDHLSQEMDMKAFRTHLENYFIQFHKAESSELTKNEIHSIQELANSKYKTEDWIMGYSPKFSFSGYFEGEYFEIFAVKGKVVGIETAIAEIDQLEAVLLNKYFSYPELHQSIVGMEVNTDKWTRFLAAMFNI